MAKLRTVPDTDTRVIEIPTEPDLTCMDVMHRFLKVFRSTGASPANTAIFENPAHAIMTAKNYTLKVWVSRHAGETALFDLKYEIHGDFAADPVSGRFLTRLGVLNPVNLFRRPQAANVD